MSKLLANIETCKTTRALAAQAFADVLSEQKLTEKQFCEKVSKKLYTPPNWQEGWYSPPPKGVAALFGPESEPSRVAYDSLRKEEFWPRDDFAFSTDSLGYVYASPVNKAAGIIGDFGLTIYRGKNPKIIAHLNACLEIVQKTAEYAQVGMELREVHNHCQNLMAGKDFNSKRMLALNDKTKNNIGHTIPWTHEVATKEESEIIKGEDLEKLKNLISSKRLYLNQRETFKIPPTIAFTAEPRMENNNNPLASFHVIIAFREGKKEIFGNFNPVFQALKMDGFIASKY